MRVVLSHFTIITCRRSRGYVCNSSNSANDTVGRRDGRFSKGGVATHAAVDTRIDRGRSSLVVVFPLKTADARCLASLVLVCTAALFIWSYKSCVLGMFVVVVVGQVAVLNKFPRR